MKLHEIADVAPVEPSPQQNQEDVISMNIPLFIRLVEYAREDAKDDMALHKLTERLTQMSGEGKTLTMDDYDAIVGGGSQEPDPREQQDPRGESMMSEGLLTDIRKLIYTTGDERKQQFLLSNMEEIQQLLTSAEHMNGFFKSRTRSRVATYLQSIKQSLISAKDNPAEASRAVQGIQELRSILSRAVNDPNQRLQKPRFATASQENEETTSPKQAKIAKLKKDYADKMRWSAEEKRTTGRDRSGHMSGALKIKAHLKSQYGVEV